MNDEYLVEVWNRAIWYPDADGLREGDRALAALFSAHVMIMADGVQGGVESLSDAEVDRAAEGYRFFGLDEVADLIQRAKPYRYRYEPEVDSVVEGMYAEYQQWASDSALGNILKDRIAQDPDLFAPA